MLFEKRFREMIIICSLFLLVTILGSLCIGRYHLTTNEIFSFFAHMVIGAEYITNDEFIGTVLLSVRIPRVAMAVLVGAALATAGVTSQGLFCNPLVSPHILGVSAGAGFGAAIGILFFNGQLAIQAMALLWGLIAVEITILLSKVSKKGQMYVLVLAGVIVTALFNAFLSLLKYTADTETALPSIVFWLMGSLAGSSYEKLSVAAPLILAGILIMYLQRWKLNIMSLSEEEALSLCRNIKLHKKIAIFASTMATAAAISTCGIIGWVGLVIPHVGRMLVGTDHRRLLPVGILLGGIYMLIIDDIARTLTTVEIPLSVLTAIIGAPFFAYLLGKTGGRWS